MVGFGMYGDRMKKDLSQPFLDFVMEVDREMPMEPSAKVSRLASWARSPKPYPGRITKCRREDQVLFRRQRSERCLNTLTVYALSRYGSTLEFPKKVIRQVSWEKSKKEAGTGRVSRIMEHNTKA